MIQPSLQYDTPFSPLSRDDVYLDARLTEIEELKQTLVSFLSEELDQQWLTYCLYRKFLHLIGWFLDETLNIILFTSEKRRMMTKLFYLTKLPLIKNKKKSNGFTFFVIQTDGDPIRLNTAETLIRRMTDSQPRILKDEAGVTDPYAYYIHQKKVKIS